MTAVKKDSFGSHANEVIYVSGLLGNRSRSGGDGGDLVRLSRAHVPKDEGVVQCIEWQD